MYKLDKLAYNIQPNPVEEENNGKSKGFLSKMMKWLENVTESEDTTAKAKRRAPKKEDNQIIFDTDRCQVRIGESGSLPTKISFREIEELVITYHRNLYDVPESGEPSKIEFKLKDKAPVTVYFRTIHYTFKQMLEELYHYQMNLKEVVEGQRVFMGTVPNEEEIQALKKAYPRIEW